MDASSNERRARVAARLAQPAEGVAPTRLGGQPATARALRAFADACWQIERAHVRGVVHNDVRSVHVTLGELGEVHVAGWDLATLFGEEDGGMPADDVRALGTMLGELLAGGCTLAEPARRELAALSTRASAGGVASARELAQAVLAVLDGVRGAGDDVEEQRRLSRKAIPLFLAYLLFAPALLWFGSGEHVLALVLLVAVSAVMFVLYLQGYRGARPMSFVIAAGNVALVVLAQRIASFMVAPTVAVLTMTGLAFSPSYARPRSLALLAVAMIAAVIVPWLAERAGWLASTVSVEEGAIRLHSPAMHLTALGQLVGVLFFTITVIPTAAVLVYSMRRR
jgi:hypothetical protein